MKLNIVKATRACASIIASQLLLGCGIWSSDNNSELTYPSNTVINTIDESALKFRAKYGTTYEIKGNTIAKYPHFDLCLFSKKITTHNTSKHPIYTYELTSKDGLGKTHIICDLSNPEKKHFFLEGLHFYYYTDTAGSINIYMPPQLMASR